MNPNGSSNPSTLASDGTLPGSAGRPAAGSDSAGEPWPRPAPDSDPRAAHGEHRQGEFRAFLDDLTELLRGTPVGDLREQLGSRIERARDSLQEAVGQAQQASAEFSQRAREEVDRTLESSRQAVVERPFTAVAAAAAIGFLVGALWGRER